jgi:hypothetical protein
MLKFAIGIRSKRACQIRIRTKLNIVSRPETEQAGYPYKITAY